MGIYICIYIYIRNKLYRLFVRKEIALALNSIKKSCNTNGICILVLIQFNTFIKFIITRVNQIYN